jgi:hypothetical protein
MTVAELIQLLKEQPQDLPVELCHVGNGINTYTSFIVLEEDTARQSVVIF